LKNPTKTEERYNYLLKVGQRLAKKLRGSASPPEVNLLKLLKKLDYKFKFQYPIVCRKSHLFILDFYFPELEVGIEVQSKQWHSTKEQKAKDAKKKRLVKKEGVEILYLYPKQIDLLTSESLLQIIKIAELIKEEKQKTNGGNSDNKVTNS